MLYPSDKETRGKQLRLEQQYFFVSCSFAYTNHTLLVEALEQLPVSSLSSPPASSR